MPAVLVEAGFLNSDTDNMLFDEHFDAIAQAIAAGILDTLDVEDRMDHEDDDLDFRVQTGLFRNWNYAERMKEELTARGFPAYLDDSGPFIAVQVGGFDSLEEAVHMEQRLKRAGYDTLLLR